MDSAAATLAAHEMPEQGRILVIDDDDAIRAAMRIVLGTEGFEVIEAENGQVGVRMAAEQHPDLIVTDWEMPFLDGRETIRRLRAARETQTIPIVMLTARSRPEDRISALDSGAQDFIVKPFERAELIARVRQQLRWRRLLSPQVQPAAEAPAAVEVEQSSSVENAMKRGDYRAALDAAVAAAEGAEENGEFTNAGGFYREASAAAAQMDNPDLANKLLRLAGKMYLCWAESAKADGKAIEDAYSLAARMFMAAGNLKLARHVVERND